jgi:putative membrane protein
MMWFGGGPFYHAWYGIGGMAMMFVFFFIAIAALFFAVRWIFGYNGCGINHMHQKKQRCFRDFKNKVCKR